MLKAVLHALALFLAVAAVGCGTMANLDGKDKAFLSLPDQEKPKPFGGVGRDFRWLGCAVTEKKEDFSECVGAIGTCFFFAADLPFSLVGDVVTLPKVLALRRGSQPTSQEESIRNPSSP